MVLLGFSIVVHLFTIFDLYGSRATGEVTLIKAEIKRNNVTLITENVSTNQPKLNASLVPDEKKENKENDQSHRKSEIYVVNNGLLLLHPKRVESLPGVKKSTNPLAPEINYHVIKKLKSNSSSDIATKVLESHMEKRSLYHMEKRSSIRTNMLPKKSRLEENEKKHWDASKRRPQISKRPRRKTNNLKKTMNIKKDLIDHPLYDDEQNEAIEKKQKKEIKARTKESKRKNLKTNKIPDIKKEFEKLQEVEQYPRFEVHSVRDSLFPRFPKNKLAELEFPRFPEKDLGNIEYPRFEKYNSAVQEYPRFEKYQAHSEFPKFNKNFEKFHEFPKFEEIKPLNLQNFPDFPEATAIPEIKDIKDPSEKSKVKRYIEEEEKNDDDDDDDNDDNYGRYFDNDQINAIGSIPEIQRPASIPDIPDIPSIEELPLIPSLHTIHGIKPIKPIDDFKSKDHAKSAEERTGESRSKNDHGKTFQNENINVKEERQ